LGKSWDEIRAEQDGRIVVVGFEPDRALSLTVT